VSYSLANSVYLYDETSKTRDTIPSIEYNNQAYVSLIHLCENLGITWQWDMYSERFTCYTGIDSITLIQNNNFYQMNDSTFQLAYPPVRSGGSLYLYSKNVADVFCRLVNRTIVWAQKDKLFTVFTRDTSSKDKQPAKAVEKTDKKPVKKDKPPVTKKEPVPKPPKETAIEKSKTRIKTIVIDPGHGGKDPGAIGSSGVKEKNVVLPIALALRDVLKKKSSLKVFMTRSTDKFIPLRKRTKFANDKNADLFISIHANSISGNKKKKNQIKGYKVYFLSQAKNEDDKLAAMIENSVIELEDDTQKGDYLQNILIDMANNEFLNESQDVSILVAESFETSLNKIKKLHRGVGQANFWVLNGAYMPAILIEACFISNPTEEKLLSSSKFQKKIGMAIGNAIIEFKKKYEAEL
jgi:N-acetylmuramoyl-L-alanine amidase